MKTNIAAVSILLSVALITTPVFADNHGPTIPPGWGRRFLNIFTTGNTFGQNKPNKSQSLIARIFNATVTAKGTSSLTITKDSKTYTVNVDSNTKYRRHFWGKSSFDEISVGDKVNVWGRFTDSTKTTILATLIRDLSIMKRHGVFIGTVSNLSGSTFTLNTVRRGAQTVTLTGSTVCVNRMEQVMSCSDIKNGDRVRVKGLWDVTNKTITEVTKVKDYSLPPKPTPTLTPTPTP